MAPVSSLSTLTSLALATVLLSSSTISAAVLPNSSVSTKKTTGRTKGKAVSTADQWCTPSFSGLVQTIRKSEQHGIVWRAVSASENGVPDGVKAASVGKSQTASMEMDLEWFVTPTRDGLFEITSGASPSYCDSHYASFDALAQHALAPDASLDSRCATPHVFSILCSSCDRHDDSASGCLLHSRARDKCVELNDEGKLRWGECADLLKDKKGLVGKEERDSRRKRQTWDIAP